MENSKLLSDEKKMALPLLDRNVKQDIFLTDEQIIKDLLPRKFSNKGIAWVAILSIFCVVGLFAFYRQVKYGLVVTNMRDYVLWGIYISNFVYFAAVSLVGALITAALRLSGVHWSTPITRIAEIIAVSAITFAGIIIVADMGRPERLLNLFLYGRLQSPITWDIAYIATYFFLSVLLLYIPLLPDLKIMLANSKERTGWAYKLYHYIGGSWKGSQNQFRMSKKAINVMCMVIVPTAFTIPTSMLFGITYRPGWDSTNFGPYFMVGAFLVGVGAVNIAMYLFRRYYKLEKYITYDHFDKMGKITVLLACLYLYFNVHEFLMPYFKMKKAEAPFLNDLFTGHFAPLFWSTIVIGMIIPIFIMLFKKGRAPLSMFICGIMIITGAWFKRYLIVTPTLLHPFLPMHNVPEVYKHYFPSWRNGQ